MGKIKRELKSVRVKLFFMLSLVITMVILFLILVNNFVLGQFYLYNKTKDLKKIYFNINDDYNDLTNKEINSELEKIAIKNNFDILVKDEDNINMFTSSKDFLSTFSEMKAMAKSRSSGHVVEENDRFTIRKIKDTKSGISYVLLSGKLDNGYLLYIRISV